MCKIIYFISCGLIKYFKFVVQKNIRIFTLTDNMKLIITSFILSMSSLIFAQSSYFNGGNAWTRNKKEIMFNAGATQFLGDLGGHNGIGKDYSLRDLNFTATFGNIGIGFRYRFAKHFATTTLLTAAMLKGDDALTKEPIRNARNLNFRSPYINLNQRIEWIIYTNEGIGNRYGLKGGMHDHNFQLYVFGGIGLAWFNPQGKYQGKWVNLRPLHTEGQGLPNGPKKYLPITASVPAGLGFRFAISRMWTLGLEATYIKTFSDYIDDVHGKYYDPAVLASHYGQASAYLSNPSTTHPDWFNPGSQRGDKQKDAVFLLNITATYNVTYKNYKSHYRVKRYKYNRSKF